jgi:ribosome-associated protein
MELKNVRVEFFKSPGPGGQHKNKRFAAVRAIHGPTGLTAVGQELRSQAQNKVLALTRLAAKVKKAYFRPKPRVATKTTRGAKERRLDQKKKHSAKKQTRRPTAFDY